MEKGGGLQPHAQAKKAKECKSKLRRGKKSSAFMTWKSQTVIGSEEEGLMLCFGWDQKRIGEGYHGSKREHVIA